MEQSTGQEAEIGLAVGHTLEDIGRAASPRVASPPKQGAQAHGMVIRVVDSAPRLQAGPKSPVQYHSPRDIPLPASPTVMDEHSYAEVYNGERPAQSSPPPPPPPAHGSSVPSSHADTNPQGIPGQSSVARSPRVPSSPLASPSAQTQRSSGHELPAHPTARSSISRKAVNASSSAPAPRRVLSPPVPSPTYRQPTATRPELSSADQIPRARQVSGESVSTVNSRASAEADPDGDLERPAELRSELQYHHRNLSENAAALDKGKGPMQSGLQSGPRDPSTLSTRQHQLRPYSSYSSLDQDLRARSPGAGLSPLSYGRNSPHGRRSPDARMSYVDLLNVPYPQPAPPPLQPADNAQLRTAVGASASLLSSQQTLDAYRANVKKTSDLGIQYSFAIFLLETAQREAAAPTPLSSTDAAHAPPQLIREARTILQRLADRSYPFAQYYLADGYASGAFANARHGGGAAKPDHDRAFPLFVAAAKHGHAEAGYRAALCYEFGWGTRADPAKAVQFYRQSAARNHPGAMARLGRACLAGDLGLGSGGSGGGAANAGFDDNGQPTRQNQRYREGVKWLKRAAESADPQYHTAPYELGLLHETGYGADVFRDETYAAQLFTQSADLGHPEANYRLGDAYEHGRLGCPRDPALSVHFYNGAAARGHPSAMMALCAWYMVGAAPVLERDENEAYEWAKRAAELGLPKAAYAVGYFTEMGIGTRRDPLESNMWYVRAADQGDERAKQRIAAIRAAAAGGSGHTAPAQAPAASGGPAGRSRLKGKAPVAEAPVGAPDDGKGKKKWGIF